MSEDLHRAREVKLAKDVMEDKTPLDRRQFLVSAAAFGAAAGVATDALAQKTPERKAMPLVPGKHDPALAPVAGKQLGRYHESFVKDQTRLINLNKTNAAGAWWQFDTYITPIEDFYIRNTYATPRPELDKRVDQRFWKLKVHGNGVERELTITYDELLKMPSRTIIATMECAGNARSLFWEQGGFTDEPLKTGGNGWGMGGIGQAEWTYVPIGEIFACAGLKKNAKHVLFWSGIDAKNPGGEGDVGRPMPVDDLKRRSTVCGLAFRMNGQDLPLDHGGPVRALVPGWCGAASIKWLSEIKVADHQFYTRLNTRQHVMIGPDYPVPKPEPGAEWRFSSPKDLKGEAVTWATPKSLITVPLVLDKQPRYPHNYPLTRGQLPTLASGPQTIKGYAWGPRYGVKQVDYRIDGRGWRRAKIIEPHLGEYTWVRFEFPWNPKPGRHLIETRMTDWGGNVQPTTVPYNKGGFEWWAVPKFHIDVI